MIRLLKESDIDGVCQFVNEDWKSVYTGFVNEQLLSKQGCLERAERLKADFLSGRLTNYVYEYEGQPVALLSVGDTADKDKKGAFEVWRLYLLLAYQNKGIGSKLLKYAEEEAIKLGYSEMVIWAFKENEHAVSFYKKHGYKQDSSHYLGAPYFAYGIRLNKKLSGKVLHK